MDDITNHKADPFLRNHYTDVLALSKLFCIITHYPSIQKQIAELWPSIKTLIHFTDVLTWDECLEAFDLNIEEEKTMKNERETDVKELEND